MNAGIARYQEGHDPLPDWAAALDDYAEALAREPRSAEALARRARTQDNWASVLSERGEDPLPRLRLAVADYEASLAIHPRQSGLREWLREAKASLDRLEGR